MYLCRCSDMHADKSQMIEKKNQQMQPLKTQFLNIVKHLAESTLGIGAKCGKSKREIYASYKDLGCSAGVSSWQPAGWMCHVQVMPTPALQREKNVAIKSQYVK